MTIHPILIKSKLAKTPKNDPRYAVKAQLKSGLDLAVADPRATRAMVALMDMQAVLGGAASHWGGPSAFAELMSATHALMFERSRQAKTEWFDAFNFVNDAGHCENGLYALKANYQMADLNVSSLKGFRSIHSSLTGHGEVHLFPEGVLISNGPLGSGLPQAQGLCAADALAKKNRLTVVAMSDGGCMEGEAREALACIPGWAKRGLLAPFVMVVSDNNTKLSGRIDLDSFSMVPTFSSLSTMGWEVIELAQGNDLAKCLQTISDAFDMAMANPQKPVCVHAKTVKGFGIKTTEKSASGGHGFPLKSPQELSAFLSEIYASDTVPEEFLAWTKELIEDQQKKSANKKNAVKNEGVKNETVKNEKVQEGISRALIKMRKAGLPIISVTSDLPGSTGVAQFCKEFPEASLDVGVAEANMLSVGIGLSKSGYIPIVDTFSQFAVTKGSLPLIMSSLSMGPVIGIFSHAGFQDAADGASHQSLSYFAMTNAIPHVKTYCLSTSEEAESLLSQCLENFAAQLKKGETPDSSLFFLGRENFPATVMPANAKYQLGKAQVVKENLSGFTKSVTIVAAGPLLHQALLASEELAQKKIGSIVVHPSVINQPDVATISSCLQKTAGRLLTVEDHQINSGMGAVLVHHLKMRNVDFKLESLGVASEFGQSAYEANELYAKHHLDAAAIVQKALSI